MEVTLYHGSRDGIVGPIRPDRSHLACDFGQGFYMGTDVHQPRTLVCGRDGTRRTLYTVDLDLSGLRLLRLGADIDWAFFVAFCRGLMVGYESTRFYARYEAMRRGHDVIFGKIANDRIYRTVTGFFDKQLTAGCLLEALQALNLGDQYCAVTPTACAAIRIVDEHVLGDAEIEKYRQQSDRQRQLAVSRTDQIILNWRHREGLYFDEILQRMADGDVDDPGHVGFEV